MRALLHAPPAARNEFHNLKSRRIWEEIDYDDVYNDDCDDDYDDDHNDDYDDEITIVITMMNLRR